MKRIAIATILITGFLAAHADAYTDHARVRGAEPQYETVNVPRNECTSHWVQERGARHGGEQQERQYGGAIIGGLAGGILGNQVGGGTGKEAATALGAVIGAITGDRLDNGGARGYYDGGQHEAAQREVKRCRTVYDTQTRLTGYRVAYEYRGQQFTTFMRSNPGSSLAVRVSVDPVEQ
jgi:uncharacterized protein YcfJ